jgi:hypothetical protein
LPATTATRAGGGLERAATGVGAVVTQPDKQNAVVIAAMDGANFVCVKRAPRAGHDIESGYRPLERNL